jgi:hypothetical protein
MEKTEVPEDLGVKIGTPEEAFWTGIKKKCEDMIEQCNHEKQIQQVILDYAVIKIEEEKSSE